MSIVEYQVADRIAYIKLNRPDKRNALSPELVTALQIAFDNANTDATAKVIVLKAAGNVFSAGADLAHLQKLQNNSYNENIADSETLKKLFYTIYTTPKLVIAQVEGHAIAGGCGLVSVCDIVFAVPEALFGYTEVKIGFIPAIVSCFLIRKLGEGRTKELLLSGELINTTTAVQYGLINFTINKNIIEEEVKNYADKMVTSTSAQSIALTKTLLNKAYNTTLENSLNEATISNAKARSSDDCKKGITAFLNKKKLSW